MPSISEAEERGTALDQHLSWLQRTHHRVREWRRWAKSKLPYVRRRVYRRVEEHHDEMAAIFLGGMQHADTADIRVLKDLAARPETEVCLFVSHAPRNTLKPHVVAHITQLCDAGLQVVLIVNTDLPLPDMIVEPALLSRLGACLVRQNLGYDFGAWAHARQMFADRMRPRRLLLVNDSIVGPLDEDAYRALLRRVRACPADVVGLTEAFAPRHHLQSFYLVFNERAVAPVLRILSETLNLPTKALVIDAYETRLTQYLASLGLQCVALFPTPARTRHAPPNDTDVRWSALVAAGFPFVKASVLAKFRDDALMRERVPERFR
jgi:hypothetical protein